MANGSDGAQCRVGIQVLFSSDPTDIVRTGLVTHSIASHLSVTKQDSGIINPVNAIGLIWLRCLLRKMVPLDSSDNHNVKKASSKDACPIPQVDDTFCVDISVYDYHELILYFEFIIVLVFAWQDRPQGQRHNCLSYMARGLSVDNDKF